MINIPPFERGKGISAASLNALRDAAMAGTTTGLTRSGERSPRTEFFFARIIDATDGDIDWVEVRYDTTDEEWIDLENGFNGEHHDFALDLLADASPGVDDIVLMRWAVAARGEQRVFIVGGSSNTFRVRLTQTGGSAGTASTPCSFTYSVYAWSDTGKTTTIGTVVALFDNGQRPDAGKMIAAGYGEAFFDLDGTLKLWSVNEKQDTGTGCT